MGPVVGDTVTLVGAGEHETRLSRSTAKPSRHSHEYVIGALALALALALSIPPPYEPPLEVRSTPARAEAAAIAAA